MRILILTSYIPYPPNAGAKIRVSNQMRYLSQEHEVVLMCPVRSDSAQAEDVQKLVGEFCAEVKPILCHKRSKIKFLFHLLRLAFSGEPVGNLYFYYEELAEALHQITTSQHFDIVDIHHGTMASYINAIAPQSKCKTVFALHNVPYVQWRRMMITEKNIIRKFILFRDWLFQKHATLKYIRRYNKTIVVSELDRDILRRDAPHAKIVAIPTGINTDVYKSLGAPKDFRQLLFLGALHYQPNIDAVHWLCKEIFPYIRRFVPDAHLLIVGAKPDKNIWRFGEQIKGVTVYADVESVLPYYSKTCLSLVPLRAGSGIRVKILESMALGRPVVSTTLGCEGLQVTHGENILIADTAEDFANHVVHMMVNSNQWHQIANNGHTFVRQTHDWRVTGKQLVKAFENE